MVKVPGMRKEKECFKVLPVPGLLKSMTELLDMASSVWYSHIEDFIRSMVYNHKVRRK